MYDLLIRNASIVDGTGHPAFPGDVAVEQGKIVLNPEGGGPHGAGCPRTDALPRFY